MVLPGTPALMPRLDVARDYLRATTTFSVHPLVRSVRESTAAIEGDFKIVSSYAVCVDKAFPTRKSLLLIIV